VGESGSSPGPPGPGARRGPASPRALVTGRRRSGADYRKTGPPGSMRRTRSRRETERSCLTDTGAGASRPVSPGQGVQAGGAGLLAEERPLLWPRVQLCGPGTGAAWSASSPGWSRRWGSAASRASGPAGPEGAEAPELRRAGWPFGAWWPGLPERGRMRRPAKDSEVEPGGARPGLAGCTIVGEAAGQGRITARGGLLRQPLIRNPSGAFPQVKAHA
jgi:hypothetical protein